MASTANSWRDLPYGSCSIAVYNPTTLIYFLFRVGEKFNDLKDYHTCAEGKTRSLLVQTTETPNNPPQPDIADYIFFAGSGDCTGTIGTTRITESQPNGFSPKDIFDIVIHYLGADLPPANPEVLAAYYDIVYRNREGLYGCPALEIDIGTGRWLNMEDPRPQVRYLGLSLGIDREYLFTFQDSPDDEGIFESYLSRGKGSYCIQSMRATWDTEDPPDFGDNKLIFATLYPATYAGVVDGYKIDKEVCRRREECQHQEKCRHQEKCQQDYSPEEVFAAVTRLIPSSLLHGALMREFLPLVYHTFPLNQFPPVGVRFWIRRKPGESNPGLILLDGSKTRVFLLTHWLYNFVSKY